MNGIERRKKGGRKEGGRVRGKGEREREIWWGEKIKIKEKKNLEYFRKEIGFFLVM